jgi:ribose transport system substrate-binding protein
MRTWEGRRGLAGLMRTATLFAALTVAAIAAGCGGADESDRSGERTIDLARIEQGIADGSISSKALGTTHGPNGEKATPSSALELTDSELAKVRAGNYTAAFVWHAPGAVTTAMTKGARDEFKQLGIRVVAETYANFDVAKQKSDIETVSAKKPSAILSIPVDQVATASAYQAAAEKGIKIVFDSNSAKGMEAGRDFVNVVTIDMVESGKRAADALAAAIGNEGTIAYFFHDANFFVTNQRDQSFLKTIETNYPKIKVEKIGVADPNKAQEAASAALLRNPDLDGLYVTWATGPGTGVLAALRASGNKEAKLVSLDIDDVLALDMAKGGNTFALVTDELYELGRAMAISAAYGFLDKEAPPFVVVPSVMVTKSTLVQGYRQAYDTDPPASVMRALGE